MYINNTSKRALAKAQLDIQLTNYNNNKYTDMEKIELLEKLVSVQEMYIELMQDYNNLKLSFEAYKEVKIGKINNLQNEIKQKDERIAVLERQNNELKQQYEELQNSIISVEEK